jgi:hypothetical protein
MDLAVDIEWRIPSAEGRVDAGMTGLAAHETQRIARRS